MAVEKGRNAIAVILSGTGTNGTKGIEKTKQAGGNGNGTGPVTAKFNGRPYSVIKLYNQWSRIITKNKLLLLIKRYDYNNYSFHRRKTGAAIPWHC
jgi:hypothetical protein